MADIKNITTTGLMAAQGLYSLALMHARKADEYYEAIQGLLEIKDDGRISDAIWGGNDEPEIKPLLHNIGVRVVSDLTTNKDK